MVGKSVRPNQVLAADVSRVHTQLLGDQVHRALHAKRGLGSARAPIGSGGGLVGNDPQDIDAHGRSFVRPNQAFAGQGRGRRCGEVEVGSQVHVDPHPHPKNGAFGRHCRFHLGGVSPAVEGDHVLLAVLHPLHGPAESLGEIRNGYFLGEHAALLAKAAAHVTGQHPYLIFR